MIKNASIATLAMFLSAASPAMATSDAHSLYVNLELALNQTTVGTVIRSISEQTGYEFSYDETLLNKKISKVSVNLKNEHIENVLKEVFKNTGISYKIVNNRVFLKDDSVKKIKRSEFAQNGVQQEKHTISGRIVDKEGLAIIGANVTLEDNKGIGTITDVDGKFVLNGISNGAILLISYIGYIDQKIKIDGGQNSYQITLLEDTQKLDEVIVIGYGVEKKVNLTGAITNVKTEELSTISTTNLSNTLAGRAPGLTIVGSSGFMGASSEIRMRGGFGDPLFVIDGIIRDKAAFDALEPNEIDQLSFLKDAATASVYGSKAGNGVVLVTTKSGADAMGKPKFEYQGSYTFNRPTRKLFSDEMSAYKELVYQNLVAEANGLPLPNNEEEMEYAKTHDYNVNDLIWQNPWNTKHSISATGGTEKVKYYVLGNFIREEGSYKNLENNKYSFRSNLTVNLSKYISLNANISGYQKDDRRFNWPGSGDDSEDIFDFYRTTFNCLRTVPSYAYLDGTPANEKTDYPIYPDVSNFKGWNVADVVLGDRYIKTRRRNVNGILSLNIDLGKILPGLSTKITGNYIINDYARKKYMSHQKAYNFQSGDPDNRFIPGPLDLNKYNIYTFGSNYENLTYGARQFWNEQFDWTLNYKNSFGKHEVGGMITFEQAESQGEAIYATANDPLTDYDQWFVFSTDPERRTVSVNESENLGSHLSWIGRATYNYDSKYMAEFSFRYDGNNKFPKDRRWGFFPSASLGWRISREAFMENTSEWLDDLKIRASYGTTGNDLNTSNKSIGYFQYIERYTTGSSYMFGKGLANGIQTGSMPTTDLTWATSATINGGIDFTLLSNRLSGTIDGFYRKETDILGSRTTTLPSTYGASLAPENYAERSWRGGEFTLTWRDKVQHGINYSLHMNIGYSKDRWDVLDESVIYMTGNLKDLSLVGMSAGRITGLKVDHLLTDQAEVDELIAKGFKQYGRDPYLGGLLFQDTRGDGYSLGPDGKIDGNDAYNLLSENGTPRINYGFGGSFSWKGITIDMHFQGVGSYDRLVGCDATKGIPQYGGNTRPYYPIWTSDKCWSPENPNGVYPRVIGKNQYESGYGNTDFWMRNGAYVRLKNLNIGYNLPASILRPLGLLHAQVFMNATNLFSISAMNEFMDPEQKYYDSFPLMRSFTFGLNFSF